MTVRSVTLELPNVLYEKVQRRAEQAHRSVEDELVEVVATAMPSFDHLPQDITEALVQLTHLDDSALWQAARSTLPSDQASEMEALNLKQQREGLTDDEQQLLNRLLRRYEQNVLVRAKAAALLKQRGHSVSELGA